jgi:hypothetical protein
LNKKKGFSAPTVSPITEVNYTLSLSTNPVAGPYSTNVTTLIFEMTNICLNQWTAGPMSSVNVSFGDGSPVQNYIIMAGTTLQIAYNYSTVGIYTIIATSLAIDLNVALVVNTITVNVTARPVYQGLYLFYIKVYNFYDSV